MQEKYNPEKIEAKWQKIWEKKKISQAKGPTSLKSKFYGLIEFPYPSGDGLHVGHIRSNTAMDVIARKRRMEGYNVLYPIGWDAFGLPTENYAIKTGISPEKVTKKNTGIFRRQLKSIGFSFDWSREINTTDPKYYKWTQWIFLQFLKNGLAYKAKININWCPKCKIGLANEEVVGGNCERCGIPVEKREKEQWMLAITKYAERLDKDLDNVDYLEKIKIQQRNWIGKSEGTLLKFKIKGNNSPKPPLKLRGGEWSEGELGIEVFTTRADTLWGATYLVLAPEHSIIKNLKLKIENWNEIEKYIKKVKNETEIERTSESREKTGVRLNGVTAINPANEEEIPVFIADYVLASYGTGAIMAVPAHDNRDFAFAKKYNLPIVEVVSGGNISAEAYVGEGKLVNSGEFDGIKSEEAREKITKKFGKKAIKFKLRDWVFSRQRYWGEPIPVVHCEKCGIVPLKEKDLPLKLPKVKNYQPTDTGESPLASILKWVNTKCPKCRGKARRETDTMPNWAGSSWYYLAYTSRGISNFQFPISNKNSKLKTQKNLGYWMPVDWYNGGMEHVTLHLLYSRFWHKFLYDLKLVPTSEPYKKRTAHGMILAANGEKMSKSRGNVINPDNIVKTFGADTLRVYEMFMGPFDQAIPWGEDNIIGVRRFLERVWRIGNDSRIMNYELCKKKEENQKLENLLHKTVKKVSEDIESMDFNTAISAMMIFINELEKEAEVPRNVLDIFKIFLKLLAPFAPHMTEELWHNFGHIKSIHEEKWPKYNESKIKEESIIIVVQINGKVRAQFEAKSGVSEDNAKEKALSLPEVQKWLVKKEAKKVIFVPNKIINFVV